MDMKMSTKGNWEEVRNFLSRLAVPDSAFAVVSIEIIQKPVGSNVDPAQMRVDELDLSVRARRCIDKMDVQTVAELISRNASELLAFKNFGQSTLREVEDKLALLGLRLAPSS